MNTRPTPETLAIWTEYLAGMRTDETAIDGFKLIERERDEAREQLKILKSKYAEHHSEAEKITSQIQTITAQRARLAEALEELRNNESLSLGGAAYEIVEQALQSLTTPNRKEPPGAVQ